MNDTINKYLESSSQNLNTILINLEKNIEFLENSLWKDSSEFSELITKITKIYFNKYFLYDNNDYTRITKYISFNNKINRKLKNILLTIIDYYENNNSIKTIREKESSILYLTVLIYLAMILYEKDYYSIDKPKTIEKVINNIIDNFQNIRFKKEKDLVTLINNIKEPILKNNNFYKYIDELKGTNIKNYFIKINSNTNIYKSVFEFNIDDLKDYDIKDINIVNEKNDILKIFNKISFDITYFTSFKLLKNGLDKILLLKVNKKDLLDEEIQQYFINRNDLINKKIKFLIDYQDLKEDYDFINEIKEKNIDIFIEVNDVFETNNYNMFMDIKNIIVPEEFLSTNEKYVEIWKDMNVNFIVKDLKNRIDESKLLKGK